MRYTRKRQEANVRSCLSKILEKGLGEQTCDFSREESHNDSCKEDNEQADNGVDDRLPSLGHVLLVASGCENTETSYNDEDDGNERQEGEDEVNHFHNGIPGCASSAGRSIRDVGDVGAELGKRRCKRERVKDEGGPETLCLGRKAGEKSHERWWERKSKDLT